MIPLTRAVASKYEWKKDARYSWNILLWLGSSGLTTSQNLSVLFCRAGRYFKSRIKHAGLWHGLPLNLISVGCFMACCTCFGLWLWRKHVGIWPLPIMEINQSGCVPWSTFAKKNTWKAFFLRRWWATLGFKIKKKPKQQQQLRFDLNKMESELLDILGYCHQTNRKCSDAKIIGGYKKGWLSYNEHVSALMGWVVIIITTSWGSRWWQQIICCQIKLWHPPSWNDVKQKQ